MLQSAIAMSQPAQVNSRTMGVAASANNRPAPAAKDTHKSGAETKTNFATELNSAADAKQSSESNGSELNRSSTLNSADLSQPKLGQTDATLVDPLAAELAGDVTAEQLSETGTDTNQQAEQDTVAAEEWILNMLGQQTAQLQARDLTQTNAGETQDLAVALPSTVNTAEKTLESKQLADQQALLIQNQSAAQKQAQPALVITNTDDGSNEQVVTNNPVTDSASDLAQRIPNHFPPATERAFNQLADQAVDQNKNALANVIADRLSGVGAAQSHDGTAATATSLINQTLTADAIPERTLKLHGTEAKWGEQMLHTLRENVGLQLQHRQQSATIRLDPPELGSMEIFLSHESGRLNVQISAQGDVARLLQQTSDRLRQELVNQQFVQVNVQVSSDNQGGQRHSRQQSAQWNEEQITQNHQDAEFSSSGKSNTHNDILVTV
jgi:flagellar hook-length control protein FliK